MRTKILAAVLSAVMAMSLFVLPASAKLPAPTNVKLTATAFNVISTQEATTGLELTWDKVAGADSYALYELKDGKYVKSAIQFNYYFYESSSQYYALLYYKSFDGKSFNFKPSTKYSFKVAAVDNTGSIGALSKAVSAKTPAFQPPVTENLRLNSVTTSAAHINFRNTAWATSYELVALLPGETTYRALKAADKIKVTFVDDAGANYYITGLKPDTTYKFKVRGIGKIDGKAITSAYSKEFTVTTAKSIFNGTLSVDTSGTYVFGDNAYGGYITFNDDGTGVYFHGYYAPAYGYSGLPQNFTFTSSSTDGGAVPNLVIIGNDFGLIGDIKYLGPDISPGELQLIKVDGTSVQEKGLGGKTFVYSKGDVYYSATFPEHQSDLPKIQLSSLPSDTYSPMTAVYYSTAELSASKVQLNLSTNGDPSLVSHTFVYDKAKNTLTVTQSPAVKTAIPKGTVLTLDYDDYDGSYGSTDFNMSKPTLQLNKDGTGTANPSGAIDTEKAVDFTYDITGQRIIFAFKTAPGASLKGLEPSAADSGAAYKAVGKIYDYVVIQKNAKAGTYNIVSAFYGSTEILGIVKSDRDISTDTPSNVIVVGGHAYIANR
ncbi:MAG: fibronectin type III domain-containing protein [Oscillospiraceae bacterium]|jgi:hypothetical protein|nr:fibronectin type III domain-containing protein [Oscillospiraceae bacterium]